MMWKRGLSYTERLIALLDKKQAEIDRLRRDIVVLLDLEKEMVRLRDDVKRAKETLASLNERMRAQMAENNRLVVLLKELQGDTD